MEVSVLNLDGLYLAVNLKGNSLLFHGLFKVQTDVVNGVDVLYQLLT